MQPRTETQIAGWEPRPVDEGYAGLHVLVESGFSGAITASEATLFMLNGRAVGFVGGVIEEFENEDLTARSASHPALALLFAMKEEGGETRATYYTNDTPIEEARSTLDSGGFTGYVELSENVLSGDYFLVYHRGRSMSVGFVGPNDRLLTDEEAESRLREEIGVYTVEALDLAEIEIPEPTASTGAIAPPDIDTPSETDTSETDEPEPASTPPDPESRSAEKADTVSDGLPIEDDPSEPATATETAASIETPGRAEPAEPIETADPDPEGTGPLSSEPPSSQPTEPTEPRDRWGSVIEEPVEDRIAAERQWRETTRIPSIDPERSSASTGKTESGGAVTTAEAVETAPEPREELLARALDALESEREAREAAERTATALREDVQRLEERLTAAEETPSTGAESTEPTSGRSLEPGAALSGTNLFVRYASKAAATLETAHAGETDREALAENLRLERRTEFESANATVGGEPFEAFLADRLEYRFAEWLVRELPFELAETGHAGSVGALYDPLPAIDRVEFRGAVAGDGDSEDDDAAGEPRHFDVVCRDRMGETLFVVDCADTRAATDEGRVAALVEGATHTKDVAPALAGAMIVTTSYFDPDALATAAEATRSGLLGGGSRESYVTISRRSGYHLCLVEMHDGTFHVTVPEL